MEQERNRESGTKNRKIILSFSFTSLLTFVFLFVAAMASAYIWGVMTGRGEISPRGNADVASKAEDAPPKAPNSVLKAHELEFSHVLRGEESRTREKRPEPAKTQEISGAETQAAAGSESGEAEPESAPVAKEPESRQATAAKTPADSRLMDYVFQVAALKDEQAVDSLREKLEGRGLRTRMERSGKLYLVMVLMRGDESRVDELDQTARELRLGAPLLRGKKPVNQ